MVFCSCFTSSILPMNNILLQGDVKTLQSLGLCHGCSFSYCIQACVCYIYTVYVLQGLNTYVYIHLFYMCVYSIHGIDL